MKVMKKRIKALIMEGEDIRADLFMERNRHGVTTARLLKTQQELSEARAELARVKALQHDFTLQVRNLNSTMNQMDWMYS